ncbi:cupredoxin domain-containing protein [Nonomuraea africana]|uniref:EfeO-type cupredoxin-like domain-containing protein n=1 Tax=Nonomuraea africana TaxID=46171 RepID=A0ABR9KI47_9ACTN|nr:hypothetical protein [Nonomuraea africana]MBE1561694.1 hypothetical protein [Nonomuraea africana]
MRRAAVLLACALVTGCGPISETHHRPGTGHEVATGAPQPGEPRAEITISKGQVSPPSGWLEVKRGQTVSLTVTSDVADELHVHGFDVTQELQPGKPANIRFKADMSGVFEVETHGSKLVLIQLAVK